MKRYFYTDPLAAAMMKKYHGMRFIDLNSGQHLRVFKEAHFYIQDTNEPRRYIRLHLDRYYIHSDSLHLLTPKDGDIGIWDQLWSGHRDEGRFTYPVIGRYASNVPYTARDWRPPMHTIIQRDGKPFIWPESEELQSE